MSYIPDIRSYYEQRVYENTKGASPVKHPNDYYQGYLNDKDAEFLSGYDFAVEEMMEDAFWNLDLKLDDLEECGFDNQRLINFENHFREYKNWIETEDEDFDFESISDTQIRLILIIFDNLMNYAEMKRDEKGTSMFNKMSDEDYRACVDRYRSGYRNVLVEGEDGSNQETDFE